MLGHLWAQLFRRLGGWCFPSVGVWALAGWAGSMQRHTLSQTGSELHAAPLGYPGCTRPPSRLPVLGAKKANLQPPGGALGPGPSWKRASSGAPGSPCLASDGFVDWINERLVFSALPASLRPTSVLQARTHPGEEAPCPSRADGQWQAAAEGPGPWLPYQVPSRGPIHRCRERAPAPLSGPPCPRALLVSRHCLSQA